MWQTQLAYNWLWIKRRQILEEKGTADTIDDILGDSQQWIAFTECLEQHTNKCREILQDFREKPALHEEAKTAEEILRKDQSELIAIRALEKEIDGLEALGLKGIRALKQDTTEMIELVSDLVPCSEGESLTTAGI